MNTNKTNFIKNTALYIGIGLFTLSPVVSYASLKVPLVNTNPATYVEQTTAELRGFTSPGTADNAFVWFEYGTNVNELVMTTGKTEYRTMFNAYSKISGLTPGTKYYFRLVAENDAGKTEGSIKSFFTKQPIVVNNTNNSNANNNNNNGSSNNSNSVVVSTKNATDISSNLFVVYGQIVTNQQGSKTSWFEYGKTTSLGNKTPNKNLGSGSNVTFSEAITDLAENTTYYYRAVTQIGNNTHKGDILNAKTSVKNTSAVSGNISGNGSGSRLAINYDQNNISNQSGQTAQTGRSGSASVVGTSAGSFFPNTFWGWFIAVVIIGLIIWIGTLIFKKREKNGININEVMPRTKELEFEQEIREAMTKKASPGFPLPGQETK